MRSKHITMKGKDETMTIDELRTQLSDMEWELRRQAVINLWPILSGVSQETMRQFQEKWDAKKPYEEFVKSQNKELLTCIDMEMSNTGQIVREQFGLPPLLPSSVI